MILTLLFVQSLVFCTSLVLLVSLSKHLVFFFLLPPLLGLEVCCNYVLYHDITFSQPQSRKHDFFYTLGVDLMMSVPEGLHFCDSGHNEWPFVLFFSLRNELGPLNRVMLKGGLSMQDKWRYLSE